MNNKHVLNIVPWQILLELIEHIPRMPLNLIIIINITRNVGYMQNLVFCSRLSTSYATSLMIRFVSVSNHSAVGPIINYKCLFCPTHWNSLPDECISVSSVHTFKRSLISLIIHILNAYFWVHSRLFVCPMHCSIKHQIL